MDVYFETRMGKPFCIEIGYFDTVLEMKEKIHKYQGIPISRQTLIFKGHYLEDIRDVEYCEIFHNSRIQLMLTPDATVKLEDSAAVVKSSKIQVFIRMAASKKQVEIDVQDSIVQLKEKICQVGGALLHGRDFSIYLHGNELHDNQCVRDYEISDDSEIDVLIKPLPQQQQQHSTTAVTTLSSVTSSGGGGNSNSKRLKIMVSTQCGTNKIPVEINASDCVGELRRELRILQEILHFSLPPEGYFFIYKQNVMEDDRSFRWHHVSNGDLIEIFNGSVTGGSS